MRCPGCGAPVHPNWDACRGCGTELGRSRTRAATWQVPSIPRPLLEGVRRAAERAREVRVPSLTAPRLSLSGIPRPPRPSGEVLRRGSGAGARALRSLRVPSGGGSSGVLLPVALAVAVGALVLVAVLAGRLSSERAEVQQARAAEAAAVAQLTQMREAADGADRARVELQSAAQEAQASASSVTEERDALQGRLDATAKELTELQAKLTEVSATAQQQTQLVEQQQQQVRVLTECLSGTLVAVEFGRSGRWSSADRALETVKDACTAARALL